MIRRLLQLLLGKGRDREEERAAEDDHEAPDEDSEAPDELVVMPIEDSIDLHTFAPRDVPSVVEEYLIEAQAKGFEEVRVIHGRGKGVQRAVVRGVLASHPSVASFRDAPATRGGWGAQVVRLKRRAKPEN